MRRVFEVAEANALLPELQRDLVKLQELLVSARSLRREQEMIKAIGFHPNGTLIMAVDFHEAEQALTKTVHDLNELVDTVHAKGCLIKDIERGLVDFPAVIDGQDVFLCWELGEERIQYYHDLRSGYAGRIALYPTSN